MTYSNYASKINSNKSTLQQLLDSISNIDLDTSWEGNAAKKQIINLTTILTDSKTQLNYLDELASALPLIDEYDNEKKLIKEYETNINNLNKEDTNYQSNVNRLTSLKNQAANKAETLKKQIEDKLANITTRYSEQYVDIPATEVKTTADLFKQAESKMQSIEQNLQIKATAINGDKTSSDNAGTIQLDKQGTYYDKEPTPGKSAQKLHVYHNGERLYDDACITIKKGETIRLTVNLSDNAGEVKLLKRTSADGQENWRNYLTGKSEPYVNRNDSSTYLPTDHYDWVITGDKVTNGYVTLSQTTFHSTDSAPEYKSMYRIKVKVVE